MTAFEFHDFSRSLSVVTVVNDQPELFDAVKPASATRTAVTRPSTCLFSSDADPWRGPADASKSPSACGSDRTETEFLPIWGTTSVISLISISKQSGGVCTRSGILNNRLLKLTFGRLAPWHAEVAVSRPASGRPSELLISRRGVLGESALTLIFLDLGRPLWSIWRPMALSRLRDAKRRWSVGEMTENNAWLRFEGTLSTWKFPKSCDEGLSELSIHMRERGCSLLLPRRRRFIVGTFMVEIRVVVMYT